MAPIYAGSALTLHVDGPPVGGPRCVRSRTLSNRVHATSVRAEVMLDTDRTWRTPDEVGKATLPERRRGYRGECNGPQLRRTPWNGFVGIHGCGTPGSQDVL